MPDPLPTVDEVGWFCDWGDCEGEAVGVRWNDSGEGIEAWLAVCGLHAVDGSAADALVVPLYALGG